MVGVHSHGGLLHLGVSLQEVALVADASVKHNKADVNVLDLVDDPLVEVHVVAVREVGDNDPCLDTILGQVILDHTLEFALCA